MEIWKDIHGFEGIYQVSNQGRVKSLDRIVIYRKPAGNGIKSARFKGRILKQHLNKQGRLVIILAKNGFKHRLVSVHRLVALAFLPLVDKHPEINHIDGVPTNNNVENLEWSNRSKNNLHAFKMGLNRQYKGADNKFRKPVNKLSFSGDFIKRYEAVSLVAEDGFNRTTVVKCCKKQKNTSGSFNRTHRGFKWEYAV